jgi:hypothetical protein
MQAHHNVTRFHWEQAPYLIPLYHIWTHNPRFYSQAIESGPIGVCLDGDARDGSQEITIDLQEAAWNTMAELAYPTKCVESVADGPLEAKPLTPCAKKWLEENPPGEGVVLPAIPDAPERGCCG